MTANEYAQVIEKIRKDHRESDLIRRRELDVDVQEVTHVRSDRYEDVFPY